MQIIERNLHNLSKSDYDKYIKINMKSRNFLFLSSIYYVCSNIYNPFIYLPLLIISYKLELSLRQNKYKSKTFEELEYYYATYITKICNLLRKLNIDNNQIEVYQFLVTLCKQGYISQDKNYEYSCENMIDISERSMIGSSIVTGYGVCRNLSYLIHDVLNELGYDTDIVFLNVPNIKNIKYKDKEYSDKMLSSYILAKIDLLKESSNTDNFSIKLQRQDKFRKIHGNHLIIGMEENNQYLLLDPTNETLYFSLSLFEKLKEPLLSEIKKFDRNSRGTYNATDKTVLLSDTYDIAILKEAYKSLGQKEDGIRYEKGIKLSLMNEKLDRLITKKQRPNEEFDKADEAFCSNKDLISDFYEENSSFYDDYANKILSLFK